MCAAIAVCPPALVEVRMIEAGWMGDAEGFRQLASACVTEAAWCDGVPIVLGSRSVSTSIAADPRAPLDVVSQLLERRTGGRLGVYVLGARGAAAGYRADERFPVLSTFKLPLVVATLARVDGASEQLERRVPIQWSDTVGYNPIVALRLMAGDHTMTVRALCTAAIRYSDNAAANVLLAQSGGPAGLTAWMRAHGDSVFRLDDAEPRLNGRPAGDEGDTSTPRATATFIDRLLHGGMLSDSSRALVLEWMRTNTTGDARLRVGAPRGWIVGDKTGTAPQRANDIGFLTRPDGTEIVVAVYTTESTAPDGVVNGVIADIARAIAR
jgi:beta-lactamase class A